MANTIAASPTIARSKGKWFGLAWKGAAWALLLGAIVYYVRRDALHYLFHYTPERFKSFWQIRILVRIHVAFAIIMIFLGPSSSGRASGCGILGYTLGPAAFS